MSRVTAAVVSVPAALRCAAPLLLCAALCALIPAQEQSKPPDQAAPRPAERTLPVFTDGQAQVVKGFADPKEWIREHLWVETDFDSDGDGVKDRMHVDVTRQQQTDSEGLKVPVVYETSPYFAGTAVDDRRYDWDPNHELGATPKPHEVPPPIKFEKERTRISNSQVQTWVPRGFAVVHSESPGTGLSQGCPTVGGENERQAPAAVIDWLCGRRKGYTTIDGHEEIKAGWCSGKVGMTGTSYNGTLPLAAATTGVDGLAAIIPISPNTSYYNYYRSYGLVRHPGGYMGEDVDVLYDFINSGNPDRRGWCDQHVRDDILKKNQDRLTGDYSEWWAGRDYKNMLGPLKAAVLLAHGFNDWNVMPEHTVRIYAALQQKGVPCMVYLHQGGHGGPPPMSLMNRWFTRFLYGIENGVETGPHAWIVREGDRPAEPTPYADYPVPGAAPVTLHPRGRGNAVGDLLTAAAPGQQPEKLVDDVSFKGAMLARAEESEHRLLFATPPLTAPLHVSGTPQLKIRLACSKPATNLSVWLVELPWTDTARINDHLITRGWADPQNDQSLSKSHPLEPGRFYELQFDLQPDDQVIEAGKRVALMIFASDWDFTLRPPPGTELTVDLDATSLELPVVGGGEAFGKAIAPAK